VERARVDAGAERRGARAQLAHERTRAERLARGGEVPRQPAHGAQHALGRGALARPFERLVDERFGRHARDERRVDHPLQGGPGARVEAPVEAGAEPGRRGDRGPAAGA
jgi:hypothetical protein